ncbi:L-fuculose-phosphate aldolase [Methanococcus maripaludis]|uniref:L-fuculose phosphate aldolase n=1 Tax=Methanococcus maripaludis TaxID=39152 RepID=A0A7J9NY21_METMI|nr:L-fuculose phosphate aldolase [Methanococcus maripaludis]MBA2852608.1 L-fuculose-phosphate aldolase [Methanococcus maripaludis]
MDLTEFIKICRLLYDRKYVVGSGGNVSIRDGNLIYITPTGLSLGFLTKEDICIADLNGNIIKGKPTSELNMHLKIYQNKDLINAVVHTHSMYCTAFSALDKKLKLVTPEAEMVVKKIAYVDYFPCGSLELAENVSECIEDSIILKNHGIVTLGKDVTEAYIKTEVLEEVAQLNYIMNNLK